MEAKRINTATDMARLLAPESLVYLERMADLVRIVDAGLDIVYENAAMRSFCSISEGDPAGVSGYYFSSSTAAGVFYTGEASTTELCIHSSVYHIKSSPIRDDHGRVIGALEVFRDFTIQNNITLELYGQNQRVHQDMKFARSIQRSMLPKVQTFNDVAFEHRYVPSDELSGDFFDIIPLNDSRVALYISDVVGHGISASILTMFVRQAMRSILEEEQLSEPDEVLKQLHARFRSISLDDDQYFSLFYAVIDTVNHTLIYANAGHNCPPVILRGGRHEFLESSGMLISNIFDRVNYEQHLVDIAEGCELLFYTDGIIESESIDHEPYGQARLGRALESGEPALLDYLITDVNAYRSGPQTDDIALLWVKTRIDG